MKIHLIALGLALGFTCNLLAGDTLNVKLAPERGCWLRHTPQEVVIKIELTATDDHRRARRTPLNLAVVLDRSGSMTGPKIEKARQAALQLVDRLRPEDVFSFVVFSDEARLLLPAQHVEDREALKDRIEGVQAGGSTALYAGVKMGADQLEEYFSSKRINRVILLSDGLANVGPSTPSDLRQLGRQLAEQGISVTTIGVGDDYNEDVMAGLAEASDANYYYVQDTEKLPEIFARELGGLLAVAAREVRIEVVCPRGVTPLGFVGRPETFEQQRAVVKLSQFAPGQERALFLRCRVDGEQTDVAQVKISYTDELAEGANRTAADTANIAYTDDPRVSEHSANQAVLAEKELMLTAVAKDEAMQQADAGNYKVAAHILTVQNAALGSAYAAAPAAVQMRIRAETNYLDKVSEQLDEGAFDSSSRKVMQEQSFNTRNAK
jgi:Ca-activated chloride channel family protein